MTSFERMELITIGKKPKIWSILVRGNKPGEFKKFPKHFELEHELTIR